MNNWKINKTVDLARGIDGVEVWPHALLVTGDKNAHEWNVTVMDNGKAASLDGIIQAYFVRSDGATVTATGTVKGNVATVTLPEACYAYEGDLSAVMQLIQDDVSVTLSALLLRVRQITTDVIIDPGTEIPSLDDLLAQIENMKKATGDANAATSKANTAATNADAATAKANASSAAADASKAAADTAANAANEAADRANKAASGVGIRKKIVDALPAKTEMEQDVLYLVRRAEPNAENVYDEYMLINGDVEAIGSTKTDLEDYAKKDELADVATSGSYADLSGKEDVATKEYVGEQIDGIEIGGRNYIHNSWHMSTYRINTPQNTGIITDIDGSGIIDFKATSDQNLRNVKALEPIIFSMVRNKEVTISMDLRSVDADKINADSRRGVFIELFPTNDTDYSRHQFHDVFNRPKLTTAWKRYSQTVILTDDFFNVLLESIEKIEINDDTKLMVIVYADTTYNVQVKRLKLEIGNKPTDWSPAPEDVDERIHAIEMDIGIDLLPGANNKYSFNPNISTGDFFKYAKNGIWAYKNNPEGHAFEVIDLPDSGIPGVTFGWKFTDNNDDNNYLDIGTTYIPVQPSQTYVLSARIRGEGRFSFYVSDSRITQITGRSFDVNSPNDWSLVCYKFRTKDTTTFIDSILIGSHDSMTVCDVKMRIENGISRRTAITYDYGGRNLKEIFGTPEALHAAIAAEDYSQIAVGDYWPITLNGTFWDCGSYTVKSGVKYYSNNTLQTQAGTTAATYEGTYVSDTAVSFSLSGTTYYVATADCLDHFERTCNNIVIKPEIGGPEHYWKYGDSGELASGKPHLLMISRDCLPFWMRMRKGNTKWEDETATNPWLGSALYKTLNDPEHGIIRLLMETELGPHIYAGPNGKGMRALLETKAHDAANATSWAWYDRGKLFLPSSTEVWGNPFWAEMNRDCGLANQFAIFRDSRRHISKGTGDSGNRASWWTCSSVAGGNSHFAMVGSVGNPDGSPTSNVCAFPLCFIFA